MNFFMTHLARWLAMFGGMVLFGVIGVTVISVGGRLLDTIGHSDAMQAISPALGEFLKGFGPILGDFELVEVGAAIAIIAFFPWCSLMRNHATVDIFTMRLSPRTNAAIDLVWEIVFTIVLFILAWRLFVGTSDKLRYGETTYLLQYPIWWGYAVCAVLMLLAALVSLYVTWQRFSEINRHGRGVAHRGAQAETHAEAQSGRGDR